jgi:polyisoprenoid-binding protein YceI
MNASPAALVAVFAAGSAIAALSFTAPGTTAPAPVAADAASYSLDTSHSSVLFKIKHNDVSWFYGRFNGFDGHFSFDPQSRELSGVEVTVQAESVDTGNKKRDDHLRSPDFFSAKEFPAISFRSASVRRTGENTFEASGDLSLHGVTRQITVPVELTGAASSRRGPVAGIHSTYTFNRSDFGMNFMIGGGLGDEVTIIVSLQGKGS